MKTETPTREQIVAALHKARGIITRAAAELSVHRNTVHKYIRQDPSLDEERIKAREAFVDEVEGHLYDKALDVDDRDQMQAIKMVLTTHGRDRGYGQKVEVSGPGGKPIEVTGDWRDAIQRHLGITPDGNGH